MKLPPALLHRLSWLNLPGALLLALLQRTPALRVAATAGEHLAAPAWGALLRNASVTLASLGTVNALAGATQWSFSRPSPISAVTGATFAPLAFTIVGAQTPPGSFLVTGLPPGLTALGANAAGVINASTGIITGTPTTPGTFVVSITGWEFANRTGDFIGPERITINVTAGLAIAPTFLVQPASQSVNSGATVTFTASATGLPAPTYQWRRNNAAIAGATTASLTLTNVQPSDTADFTVVASNSAGTVTSDVATLNVTTIDTSARLTNLSVRTALGVGQTLIVGVSVADGSRDILVRAAGPALAAFGLSTAMVDPSLELYSGSTLVLSNNDWAAALAPTFASVGAFAFPPGSKDAAFLRNLTGGYSIQARGTGAGVVLVEAYDTGAPTAARLVNVSARNRVGTGDDILIAGFTVSGTGPKPLLIRAVGPKLGAFGVTGFLVNPKLEIYNGSGVKVTENDDWSATLAPTFSAVGAFALDPGSRDAALLTNLAPGSYTAQVSGVSGGTGEALIEIYEVR